MQTQTMEEKIPKSAIIMATYEGATFSAKIDPADVDKIVADAEGVDSHDPRRNDAENFVMTTIESNEHLKQDIGAHLGATLLWLACTMRLGGEAARESTKQGGALLWEISQDRGVTCFRMHIDPKPWRLRKLRLVINPDPIAATPSTPKRPLPRLPGSPLVH